VENIPGGAVVHRREVAAREEKTPYSLARGNVHIMRLEKEGRARKNLRSAPTRPPKSTHPLRRAQRPPQRYYAEVAAAAAADHTCCRSRLPWARFLRHARTKPARS
jgi:hypothetical protein